MSVKAVVPKGTRDHFSEAIEKRNYIFSTIRNTFKTYGFKPIETPSFENLSTLTGKYGEEGDRLIFKILNSGDKLGKADTEALAEGNLPKFANSLSAKALRYDLTVPFARFVVQHRGELSFPFKRYQIQPVWRADRPAKGRYQEFYQCDCDVIGSESLWYEVEFVQIYDTALSTLGLKDFSIKLNNRKILTGIAEKIGALDMVVPITVALDKLDKIGEDKVQEEWKTKGLSDEQVDGLTPLFQLGTNPTENIAFLKDYLKDSETGLKGIKELEFIFKQTEALGLKNGTLDFDVTLARGLDYYTGAIFEVKSNEVEMGSIGGGGRYNDLTGAFGLRDMPGVGISFGAERIYDVLTELNNFPEELNKGLDFCFVNFGNQEVEFALPTIQKLRAAGKVVDLYPEAVKMKKQMKYANDKHATHADIVGDQEMENGTFMVKNMLTGEQQTLSSDQLLEL